MWVCLDNFPWIRSVFRLAMASIVSPQDSNNQAYSCLHSICHLLFKYQPQNMGCLHTKLEFSVEVLYSVNNMHGESITKQRATALAGTVY